MKFVNKLLMLTLITIIITSVSIASVFAETFYYIDGFEFTRYTDGGWTISDYRGDDSDLIIPDTLLDVKVSAIYPSAFMNNQSITSVYFPESIKSIGAMAFRGCTELSQVHFSSNLTIMALGCFQYCPSLKTIDLSDTSINSLGQQAFYSCENLEVVYLPETCTEISSYAFYEDYALERVYIPASVTAISANSFNDCPNLTFYCYSNSYAHQYAQENGIPYVLLDEINYEIGDADMDGDVTISDVTAIQKSLVDVLTLTEEAEYLADVDKNGIVNIDDATNIQKYLAEIINSFE